MSKVLRTPLSVNQLIDSQPISGIKKRIKHIVFDENNKPLTVKGYLVFSKTMSPYAEWDKFGNCFVFNELDSEHRLNVITELPVIVKKRRIGLIGKMRGLTEEAVKRKFLYFQLEFEAMGYEVFNPYNLGLPHTGWTTNQYLERTFPELDKCHCAFIMADYTTSEGSISEFAKMVADGKNNYRENGNGLMWAEIDACTFGIHPTPTNLKHKRS